MAANVGQYTQRPGQGAGMVITATGVTPEMVRVDFLMVDGCFFISMISVTKSAWTNKPGNGRLIEIIILPQSLSRSYLRDLAA